MKIVKQILKWIGYLLLLVVVIILGGYTYLIISSNSKSKANLSKLGEEAKTITEAGVTFRDLNKNGKLDVYEDSRMPVEARVSDLISQMTLEEKAGTMFFGIINVGTDGELAESPTLKSPLSFLALPNSQLLVDKKMNHFNLLMTPGTRELATWSNNLQKAAERTRLGIPVTIGSDPRNHFTKNEFVSQMAGDFSQWPEPTGFAAIGDSVLMQKFGDIARQEYRAVGIHIALHPMADLATEPRWPRINGTFGEDAQLAAKMVYAYIKGFQGDSLTSTSVACMTKHFSGGGPQKEGLDPHFQFQKGQVYPGNNFNYHLIPFEAAFAAGTAQIMPYYGVPMDQTSENVGFAFNKDIITTLLREKYHFDGVVCTDWGVISDVNILWFSYPARAHGVLNLPPEERMLKAINAGMDQFGGENIPEMLVKLVKDGKVSEERVNESVRRILKDKFRLGLFDNPYVDVEKVVSVVGKNEFRELGMEAQRKALVLLKNGTIESKQALPLSSDLKIYVRDIDKNIAAQYGTVVNKPEDADLAIIRIATSFQPMPGLIEGLFHHGDLDFKDQAKGEILDLLKKVPTIVDIYLDRPAVIPEISEQCAGLIGNFGASDQALLDVVFGKAKPEGHLPFELPSSMEAVRTQFEDVPYDSKDPLYKFGFGLTYPN
jgi:beta-glucosidase